MEVKFETGTLKDLNVKAGDVVEDTVDGMLFEIERIEGSIAEGPEKNIDGQCNHGHWATGGINSWRIVSRASDTPKTWGEMTDAEKGDLLLADHEGKVIECWGWPDYGWAEITPSFDEDSAYRVRPEPKREVVKLAIWRTEGRFYENIGTIETENGKPDPATIKMDEL